MSYTGSASLSTTNTADSAGVAVTSGSIVIPTTSSSNRAFAVVTAGSGNVAFTAGTQRYSFSGAGSGAATGTGAADIAGTGSNVTISWTQTSDWFGAIGVEIKAGGAAASAPLQGARRAASRTPALPPVRRYRQMLPVPAQLNPPYPHREIAQRRQTWPRAMPHRGHVTFVVPPQLNPPYPFAEIRQWRQPRGFCAECAARQVTPVPPQLNPPYPWAEIARRQAFPRGLLRRGRIVYPVAGQAAAVAPAWVPQPLRHARIMASLRRRPPATPVPGQDLLPQAARRSRPQIPPRRGHGFMPVPAQQAAAPNPAITFQQPKHLRMV